MTAVTSCRACGTELMESARFCHACGSRSVSSDAPAEYKQVTVLFADVVASMDLAAAVGEERLREVMADLVSRSTAVVARYGGIVDKFTGDGIMALFGAPVALEDHAFRACAAALGIQQEAAKLALDVTARDGIDLSMRIGLNSGQVIAGELGSGPSDYTAIGAQVGMAQRMESVAPPGGIMLSESTARLVHNTVELAERELVHIKGADDPVPARRLLASSERRYAGRQESTALFGRTWEMNTISGILDEAIGGAGCVVCVLGPPGIGKSRITRESAALAVARGVDVFMAFCESHMSDIPFHAVAQLLRAQLGVNALDDAAARTRVRTQLPSADPEDMLLLDDLLGIGDPAVAQPMIEADARRRRLTALVNAAALGRSEPALYVIEDVHWIDDVSEAMIADFLPVIAQTRSTVLITYRPEYHGALTRVGGAQAISLRPLNTAQASALIGELLGPGAGGVSTRVAERAAGNPFFAEEIVRDLAERGLLEGTRGWYSIRGDVADVSVPPTLQATIAARIDRLEPTAKRTLGAASVVGMRFSRQDLESLGLEPAFDGLVANELIDQVRFTERDEYVFRHPLIRAVAYEAQLASERAKLHRRLAAAIEARSPDSIDENAALIAEHIEAAGDLSVAFDWHMRAGGWLTNRDIAAARTSWLRARQVADRLPVNLPERVAMRIAPRTLLCTSTYRGGGSLGDTGFEELRDLCTAAGDQVSLAIGMAGLPVTLTLQNRHREASQLASEQADLLESIDDPLLTVGMLHAAMTAKLHSGEATEALRLQQQVIDLAGGDVHRGEMLIGSPLAQATMLRGLTRCCLGDPDWRDDIDRAVELGRSTAAWTQVVVLAYPYLVHLLTGALVPDEMATRRTAEALQIARQSGDDFTLAMASQACAMTMMRGQGSDEAAGHELLMAARESPLRNENGFGVMLVDLELAAHKSRKGDLAGAIEMARVIVDEIFENGEMIFRAPTAAVLVESLLRRCSDGDVSEAEAVIERLAAVPTEPGFVLSEIHLLRMRALLARSQGDQAAYRQLRDRYRETATALGFAGHVRLAELMPAGE